MSKTIDFFYEISKIPRESGNEENIANYICNFAEKRNLYYEKDEYNNVIVKKKNSEKPSIILQAHMDMVCEKENEKEFNFKTDAIEIYEENGYLKANGTTLGADNGIGVAQILNVLDSQIKCNIEAVFTVAEETTMLGAEKIDLSSLKGKEMISLDGFEENTVVIESACFYDIVLKGSYTFKNTNLNKVYTISLQGLEGGHSGFDIDKNRGNASILLAELLSEIENVQIINFVGGTKFNVIPSSAECEFVSTESKQKVDNAVKEFENLNKEKYKNLKITLQERINEKKNVKLFDIADSQKYLKTILNFKHGIFYKNEKEQVTTSMNLGIVDLNAQELKIGMRSSRKEEERACVEYIEQFAKENNLEFIILGSQPGFETKEDSKFVQKIKTAFEKIDKSKLTIKPVHITVETGIFKEKVKELEIAIISPKILNAHTVSECVSLETVERCDKWLEEILGK